jgi:hypothetical protein
MRRYELLGLSLLFAFLLTVGNSHYSWAVQRHTLIPEQEHTTGTASEGHEAGAGKVGTGVQKVQSGPEGGHDLMPQPAKPAPEAHGAPQQEAPHSPQSGQESSKGLPSPAHPPAATGPGAHLPETGGEHGAEGEHGGEHGPGLPQISPIPGVTFVETMIKLMDYELHGRFLGWRPNDIVLGQFTDDVNYYQLGVLEALRFTTLRLKDSLTRMGDADSYDPDLELALNLLMNRSTSFWFPSAETSYGEAVDHLKAFLEKLKTGQRSFYYRKDNLVLLIATYKDLLGNVNRNLISADMSWFKTDDNFYYAKGVSHVFYEILRVVRVGYQSPLASTMNALDIMDEILHELHREEEIDPWIILDSDLDGFFANHRANLNAPLSEVAHLLGVLSTF